MVADLLEPAAWTPAPAEWRYPALYCIGPCCVGNWAELPLTDEDFQDGPTEAMIARAVRIPQERQR